MAGTTGLEPATSAVTGQRSNQLSYVPTENINCFRQTPVDEGLQERLEARSCLAASNIGDFCPNRPLSVLRSNKSYVNTAGGCGLVSPSPLRATLR